MKKYLKRALAATVALCMTAGLCMWGGAEIPSTVQAASLVNLAPSATITTKVRDTDSKTYQNDAERAEVLKLLNDGKKDTSAKPIWRGGLTATAKGTVGPVGDYYEFTWKNSVSVNKVNLYFWQTTYSGPSAWHVDVTEDGTNWKTVGTVIDAEMEAIWQASVPSRELTFKLQENVRALRVYIDKGYLEGAGYGIHEIEIYNDPAAIAAEGINLAPSATITTKVRDTDSKTYQNDAERAEVLKLLNDGKKDTSAKPIWRGGLTATAKGTVGPVGDYYEFTWKNSVSVNKVNLYFWQTTYSGPSAWHVDVTEDGTNWKTVGTVIDAEMEAIWQASVPSRELTFKLQENVRALRVYIDKGYLEGAGYGIHEIEIYNDPAAIAAEGINLAPSATLTTEARDADYDSIKDSTKVATTLARLTDKDGDANTLWRKVGTNSEAGQASEVDHYYQFTWHRPISVNKVDLVFGTAKEETPADWHVAVTKNGTDWTTVGSISNTVANPGEELRQELSFDLQEEVTALRVYIDTAYMKDWGGYALCEIEIYHEKVALNGHSLVADGITKLNFFYDLGLNQTEIKDEGSYITFEIPGVKSLQKIRLKDAVKSEHGYEFQYSIPAKHMADTIKANLYIEGLKYEQSYEYSIKEYANSIVNGKEYNEKDKALAIRMLHYGAYAQQYFDYNTENLANVGLDSLDLDSVTAESFSTVKEGNVLAGSLGSIVASHLTLDAETTLHLYFRPAEDVSTDTLTFKYDNQYLMASKYTANYGSSNQETWLHIAIPNIAAHALSETQEVIVSDGASTDILGYSALTYGYNVLKNSAYNSNTALQNLVKALYLYNGAAVSKKKIQQIKLH